MAKPSYNTRKLTDVLKAVSVTGAPIDYSQFQAAPAADTSMAKYLNNKLFGFEGNINSVDANEEDREKSGLTNTFEWMMSLGSGVQNTIMDVGELAAGEDSFSDTLGDIGKNVAAAGAGFAKPFAEIAMIPGIQLPGIENAYDNTVDPFVEKHNVRLHGGEKTHGSELLKQFGYSPNEDSALSRIAHATAGFGVDVLTDPLTYAGGVGLASKGKSLGNVIDAAKGVDEPAEALNKAAAGLPMPQNTQVPAAFSAPAKPEIMPSVAELVTGKVPNTGVGNIKVGEKTLNPSDTLGPVDEAILKTRIEGLNPTARKSAHMSRINQKRWYEDLHPIPVEGPPVKNLKPHVSTAGKESVDDVVIGDPRELTRPEFRAIFEESQAAYKAAGGKLNSSTDPKYFAKGVEDALQSKGFKLPEKGELSKFIGKGGNLDDYLAGKPLKEMPDYYPLAKEAKVAAKGADTKGFDPSKISEVIDDIAKGGIPRNADKFLPPTGAVKARAAELADEVWAGVGTSKIPRGSTLNAPNQANMYNRMVSEARKTLGRKASKEEVRNQALQMMRAAENHMIGKGVIPVVWGGASLRLTDVIAELSNDALDSTIPQIMKAFAKSDPTLIKDKTVQEIVTRALASRQLDVSAVANSALGKFKTEIEGLWDNFTPAAAERRAGLVKARLNDELRALGVSPDETNAVMALARTRYVDPDEFGSVPFEDYHKSVHAALKSDINAGEFSPRMATALSKAIEKVLEDAEGVYNTYKTMGTGKNLNKNAAQKVLANSLDMDKMDSMLARMTTWYGRGPEWHTYKNSLGYAEKLAMTRAKWFRDINSKFTREEQIAAWGIMTGRLAEHGLLDGRLAVEGIQDTGQRELALKLFDYLDWTVGHKSAWNSTSANALDGVTALKSGMTMADVDRQLAAIGSPISFAKLNKKRKGQDNWLSAIMDVEPWDTWRKTPASMLLDIDRAMTRTHMNYAMVDDFVARMGRREGVDAGFNSFVHTAKIKHTRIPDDMKFEPTVAKEFSRLLKELDEAPWSPGNKASKAYFTALRHWKSGVTIYSPSHHVRNSVGDAWLMWMAGVNNPRVFRDAQKLMWAHRANYKGALKVDANGNPPELDRVMGLISRNEYSAMSSQPGTNIITRRGVDLNADDIYRAADERGLFATADQLEDIIGGSMFKEGDEVGRRGIPKPLGGRGHNAAAKITEYREHYFRSAHFIDVVRKGITPAVAKAYKAAPTPEAKRQVLDKIYDEGAKLVRKWHPDGRDLTNMEQRWGRGLIPFYSWQRKSIPLFIQAMVENPQNIAKMSAIPRANFALQESLGIEAPSPADAFPTDEIFPDWIRAQGMGPIGDVTMGGVPGIIGGLGRQGIDNSGEQYGHTIINPGNPLQDFIKDFAGMPTDTNAGGVAKTLMDQSTPIFQWASALQSKEKTTGAPITREEGGNGWGEYALSQVPIASHLQRWTDFGKDEREGVENAPINTQALLNYLTGAGIIGTGMYNKSAEFNQRDYYRRLQENQ